MTLFTSAAEVGTSRPRPPRLIWPPLRPAARASSALHSCAVPFSCAARPPLLAISRCFSGDIEANPRRSFLTPSTALLLATRSPPASHVAATRKIGRPSHTAASPADTRLQGVCQPDRMRLPDKPSCFQSLAGTVENRQEAPMKRIPTDEVVIRTVSRLAGSIERRVERVTIGTWTIAPLPRPRLPSATPAAAPCAA